MFAKKVLVALSLPFIFSLTACGGDADQNVVRDIFASITDIIGGRSGAYETKLADAREIAMQELEENAKSKGGNAVVGVDLDYEVVGQSMLMVSVSGTAVVI